MIVSGNTSGDSQVDITNRKGFGEKTNNGIEIIAVGGNSDGLFTLKGDYKTRDGQQAIMTDSAYAYTLQKGGSNTPDDGNWYLCQPILRSRVPIRIAMRPTAAPLASVRPRRSMNPIRRRCRP
jgi:outer membrane autotransporter protein